MHTPISALGKAGSKIRKKKRKRKKEEEEERTITAEKRYRKRDRQKERIETTTEKKKERRRRKKRKKGRGGSNTREDFDCRALPFRRQHLFFDSHINLPPPAPLIGRTCTYRCKAHESE